MTGDPSWTFCRELTPGGGIVPAPLGSCWGKIMPGGMVIEAGPGAEFWAMAVLAEQAIVPKIMILNRLRQQLIRIAPVSRNAIMSDGSQ